MQVIGEIQIVEEFINFIRYHENNRTEILQKERHLFRTKSGTLDNNNRSTTTNLANILVIVNVSYNDRGWSHKFITTKNPFEFEINLPATTTVGDDDKIIFHFLIHTTSENGIIARRRIGTVAIKLINLEIDTYRGRHNSFTVRPLVNSKTIHNNTMVGIIRNMSIVWPTKTDPNKHVKIDAKTIRMYDVYVSAVLRKEEMFWRQCNRSYGYQTKEIELIRLESWRTPIGKGPLKFFFWNSTDAYSVSDPYFFDNAIDIALQRLGGLTRIEFLEYAESAFDPQKTTTSDLIKARLIVTEVVASAIANVVTSAPYLIDMARIPSKNSFGNHSLKNISVEHFARSADSNSGDCEDLTNTALLLWTTLKEGKWEPGKRVSKVVKTASAIARQYVHIALLASVTCPSISSSNSKNESRGEYVSVNSREYSERPFTGHCFAASLPHNYLNIITSSGETVSDISDRDFWPTIIVEGTGLTRVFPLPYTAYRGATTLSEDIDINLRDENIFKNKLHKDISLFYSEQNGRSSSISNTLKAFTSVMKDDMLSPAQYKEFKSDANVSPFYRFLVWAYLPTTNKVSGASYILKNRVTGALGISYRLLASQDPSVHLIKSPGETEIQLTAVKNRHLKFLLPSPSPTKTQLSGSKLLRSGGRATSKVLRLYRAGYFENERLAIISSVMDKEVDNGNLVGYKIFHDNFGEFKTQAGSWSRDVDDAIQSTRLELYLK